MSISISETGGGGRDSLLFPLLSRESWMFAKDNPDRKKKKKKKNKAICQKYQKVETVSEIIHSKGITNKFSGN